MASPPDRPRTALVLSGGGARAAYQVGVLRYIGRRCPDFCVPILTGVSAGAINAAFLASHRGTLDEATADLAEKWCSLRTENVLRTDAWTMFTIVARWAFTLFSGGVRFGAQARSLMENEPLRRFLGPLVDADRIQANVDEGRLEAVAISATSYHTGRTVTFVQGGPDVEMWRHTDRVSRRARIGLRHVMASAAIPLIFPAEKVGQSWYGDGSVRQSAPLAPAIHLDAERVIAISSRYGRGLKEAGRPAIVGYPPAAQVAGLLMNSIFLDTLEADVNRTRRINRLVDRLPSDRREDEQLRHVDLLVLRPSLDLGRLALNYETDLPRNLRFLSRGLGTRESESPDLLSYLLYESSYISRMVELGEEDAERHWHRISHFLGLPEEEKKAAEGTEHEEAEATEPAGERKRRA